MGSVEGRKGFRMSHRLGGTQISVRFYHKQLAMKEEVSHRGRVLSVDAEKIRVEIISSSACTSCHAAGLCSMSEAVKKIVDVPVFGNSGYAPGDEVELVLTASMGMKAVSACMMPSPRSSENHS